MTDGSIRIDTKIGQSGIDSGLSQIEKSCNTFASTITGIFAGISVFEFGKAALKSTGDIELAQAKLETLLGSASAAQSMIDDIVKMADRTPYESNDLIQAATTLKTFGVTADQIMPTLEALGNAAGGQAQNLQGVAYALGQTAAQGKMMTQDLYQFINAGVPLLELLAKQLGKNKAEIKAMIEEGKVGYKEVNAALQEFYTGNGKYADLMAKAAQTLPGMFSTMQDAVMSFGRALVTIMEPAIKNFLQVVTAVFSGLANFFNGLSTPVQNVMRSFGSSIAIFTGIAAAVGVATTAFRLLFDVLRSNPFLLIISLVGTLIVKLMDLGDATQNLMGLTPAEYERAAQIYERLAKKQQEFIDRSDAAGAGAGITRMISDLQHYEGKLANLTPKDAEWTEMVAKAEALSKILYNSRNLGFVNPDDVQKIEELKNKFEDMYKAKRKAEGERGGANLTGGVAAVGEAVDRGKKIWQDYWTWKASEEEGDLAADLLRLEYRNQDEMALIDAGYAQKIDAAREAGEDITQIQWQWDAVRKANEEKYNFDVEKITEKWAARHEVAAFLMGVGMTEKMAEGIESGLHSVVSAVEEIGETIADTFEAMSEIFDIGAGVLDWIVGFNYSDLETRLTKYINAIDSFFKNNLGSMTILFDLGAKMVGQLLAGLLSNLPAIVSSVGNLIQHVSDYIITNGPTIIAAVMEIVFTLVEELVQRAPELFRAVLVAVISFITELAGKAETFADFVGTAIASIIDTAFSMLPQLLTSLVTLAINVLNGVVKQLPQIFTSIANAIGPLADALAQALPPLIIGIVNAIPLIILALVDALPAIVTALVEAIPALIEALIMASPQIAVAFVRALVSVFVTEVPGALALALGKMVVNINLIVAKYFVVLQAAVVKALGKLLELMYEGMSKAGKEMIKGLIEGILSGGSALWSAVKRVFSGFIDSVKAFFGIHSPSTVFYSIGLDIIQGLINGLFSGLSSLFSAGASLASSIISGVSSLMSGMVKVGASLIDALISGVTSVASNISTAVYSAVSSALSSLASLLSGFYEFGSQIGQNMISGLNSALGTAGNTIAGIYQTVKDSFDSWLPDWFASGTRSAPGGWAVVGEEGPELVNLRSGSTVLNAADSIRAVMAGLTPRSTNAASGGASAVYMQITPADVVIDGNVVGRVAFRYIDKQVKTAYGA